jgi:4-amino-4-deoxy-L-arabinose transferase-like glycosyltransferase
MRLTDTSPARYNCCFLTHTLENEPGRTGRHETLLFGLLLLGTGLLCIWQLGRLPLIDVDEPVYGQVGREMAFAGWRGWLSPHYGGQLWFDKPPLFYWLTALAMRLFGVSELAARLPSALMGVGLVAATYALARRAFPGTPRAGLWAGFVLATCVQFFLLARAAVTDMTLAVTLTLALLGLFAWAQTGRGRWMVLAGAMTGLAALTKGPVALVLVGVQAIGYLLLTRQAKRLLSPALWGGFALCLVVGLPWYLVMVHLHGQLFIQGFLEANNVTRYLQAEHKETSNPFYYFAIFPVFFFPWTLLLPSLLIAAGARKRLSQSTLFLVLWSVLVFGFFSISQTKLVTYIFPMFPAVAILVGRWLAETCGILEKHETSARLIPLWSYAGLSVVLGVALFFAGRKLGITLDTRVLWLVVLVSGAILSAVYRRRGWVWAIPGVVTALVLLLTWCSPTWKTRETDISERRLAAVANRIALPGQPIYSLGLKHPSLRFYATRPVIFTDDRVAAAENISRHVGVVYAMRPETLDELRTKFGVTNATVAARYARTVLVQAAEK